MVKLNKSEVVFDQKLHTYHFKELQLSGITSILRKQLFPDKYTNIPDFILKRAAEYGTSVHESIELSDSLGVDIEMEEVLNYKKLKEENGLKILENEYLVSDDINYATCIDNVFEDLSLGDIKTTAHFDNEYVSWQLSICAYLFELQNPGLFVNKLYGIWLRKEKYELIEVERKPLEVVKELLSCSANGVQFINPYALPDKKNVPAAVMEMEQFVIDLDDKLKKLKADKDALFAEIYKQMKASNVEKWQTERISFTRKKPTFSEKFDQEAFKKENPELYSKFIKVSPVKGSILFKKR